jgi:cytochrome P450
LPPGPGTPGVLQTLLWMYRPVQFAERCYQRYGQIFTLRLGPDRNVVLVAEPAAARAVVAGDPEVFRAGDANGILRPVVGSNSLLVLDGPEHMRHRRILLPAFDAGHALAFADRVGAIARERVSSWRSGETLRLQNEMEQISLEAILGVVFGDEGGERRARVRALIPEMMRRCASPFTLLPYFRHELGGISPYGRLRRVLDELDRLFYAAIAERRASGRMGDDVLSVLVGATDEEGFGLPDTAIRDEVLTLIMAGYETTTSALAWSFERLLRSPHVLEPLLEELASGRDRYLDAVVKESLRLRPVVPVVARRLRAGVELEGHRIPAGSVLMVSVHLLHRDPRLYEDPDEFRPERFLEGEEEGGVWIPFGGGVRRCMGASFAQLEMKVVMRTVLERVRLRAPSPEPEPVARRRFTFAPARDARAIVEGVNGAA